jgi:hypothetical protein
MRKQSRNPEQDLGLNSTKITELKSESQAVNLAHISNEHAARSN